MGFGGGRGGGVYRSVVLPDEGIGFATDLNKKAFSLWNIEISD